MSPQFVLVWKYSPCHCIRFPPDKLHIIYHQKSIPKTHSVISHQFQECHCDHLDQLLKYLNNQKIYTHLYLATDGSFKYPHNKYSFLISDHNVNPIISGTYNQTTPTHLRSYYDAEMYSVLIGLKKFTGFNTSSPFEVPPQ